MERHHTLSDRICLCFDQALRALMNNPKTTEKAYPGTAKETTSSLDTEQRKHSARLMRINHAGEICAQALYHGQAITSHTEETKQQLKQAALEEGDHLAWCKKRLDELDSHTSYLNPLWYIGSFCIGIVAGVAGDTWSLGFIAETEQQVIKHLESHLALLAATDARSYQILQQMAIDEAKHRDEAIASGANTLPNIIKKGMSFTAKIMVKTAYWV